jgi:predicted metal-dependent hydrolase
MPRGSRYTSSELRDRVDTWVEKLSVSPRVVRIQKMSSKWGSCSHRGTITLASDLGRESTRFQDVVIVHELLHLRIRNHGKLFRALMAAHVPGWQGRSDRAGRCTFDEPNQ